MSSLQHILEQIQFARNHTLRLLDTIESADWFRMAPGGVTHVGWQVGHLAMAQYRLALERIRGHRPEDESLIGSGFLAHFARDSVPNADASIYPPAEEIRLVFDRVHEQTLRELGDLPEAELDLEVLKPHPLVRTKKWALVWCAQHEAVHAGQIGLIRRQLGASPVW